MLSRSELPQLAWHYKNAVLHGPWRLPNLTCLFIGVPSTCSLLCLTNCSSSLPRFRCRHGRTICAPLSYTFGHKYKTARTHVAAKPNQSATAHARRPQAHALAASAAGLLSKQNKYASCARSILPVQARAPHGTGQWEVVSALRAAHTGSSASMCAHAYACCKHPAKTTNFSGKTAMRPQGRPSQPLLVPTTASSCFRQTLAHSA